VRSTLKTRIAIPANRSTMNTNSRLLVAILGTLFLQGCYDSGQFDDDFTGTGAASDSLPVLSSSSTTAGTPEGHENPGIMGESSPGSTSSNAGSTSGGATGTSNSTSGVGSEAASDDEADDESNTGGEVGDESITAGDADEGDGDGDGDVDGGGDGDDDVDGDGDVDSDEGSSESGSECTDAIKTEQAKCVNESEKHSLDLLSDCRDDLYASIEFVDTEGLDGEDLDAAVEKNSNLERIYTCRSERECYSMKAETQDEFYDCLQECATDFDWGRNGCAVDHDIAMTKCYENRTTCSGNTALDRAANKQCFDALNPVMQACVAGLETQF